MVSLTLYQSSPGPHSNNMFSKILLLTASAGFISAARVTRDSGYVMMIIKVNHSEINVINLSSPVTVMVPQRSPPMVLLSLLMLSRLWRSTQLPPTQRRERFWTLDPLSSQFWSLLVSYHHYQKNIPCSFFNFCPYNSFVPPLSQLHQPDNCQKVI